MALTVAPGTDAQPKPKKEKKEKKPKKEKKDKKEKKKELKELEAKEEDGSLGDEGKKKLDAMRANRAQVKARHDRLKARHKKLKETQKTRRRAARRAAIKLWGREHLRKKPVRKEMQKHARRMARLDRLRDIARAEGDKEATARINKLVALERTRHKKRMGAVEK